MVETKDEEEEEDKDNKEEDEDDGKEDDDDDHDEGDRFPGTVHWKFTQARKEMFRAIVRATTDAARRAVAWKFEDLQAPKELSMFRFSSQDDLRKWTVHSDSDHGGKDFMVCRYSVRKGLSSADLGLGGDGNKTAIFSGTLSEVLREPGSGSIVRSGFSGMRTIQGACSFDLDSFDTLAFRVKGDWRCYVTTIRTESWWGTFEDANTWQSMLFSPKDEWFEVMIPLSRYLPTMKGKIIEIKNEMNRSRVCGLGLGLSAQGGVEGAVLGPGDFRLELDWIKALRTSGS
ncbi:hypothetical protein L7F22_027705 [Adiantum nelumboides]|nr:hypothetical protein [Adiantum nelumboides]